MISRKLTIITLAAMLAYCLSNYSAGNGNNDNPCALNKEVMLNLDEQNFDQGMTDGGGWRKIASRKECELVAADLIAEYRQVHGDSPLLFWHEGQLRAFSGQYTQAIALFEKSYKPKQQDFGWNAYADATIAFLEGDAETLEQALSRLKSTPPPPGETLRDGLLEVRQPDGTTFRCLGLPM